MDDEPPFGIIARLLLDGQVVPLLGAGASAGSRPTGANWDSKEGKFLPRGSELATFLARESSFPSTDEHDRGDLPKVASYFVDASGRPRLRQFLSKIFNKDFEVCEIHHFLAELSVPLLIVTTNYDDLIERAFAQAGKSFDLVVHPTDRKEVEASVLWWQHGTTEPQIVTPNTLNIDLEKTTVIYKMHGSVDRQLDKWHSYVVSEEDYIDFLSRMTSQTAVPALFAAHFRPRQFLFLGYSLSDWNFRVVLRNLETPLPGQVVGAGVEAEEELRSWAIQYQPSRLEQKLWDRRNVNIYDLDINEFTRRLRQAVHEA
jgi:SIR2-like domain